MSELQNANPTIRAAADLPSRRRDEPKIARKEDEEDLGMFAEAAAMWTAPPDPFDHYLDSSSASESDEDAAEPIDEQEIYDLISTISDPEHPLSLGSLAVVNLPDIHIKPLGRNLQVVTVEVTPTITHCSLATVIGLGIRVRLERALPPRFRIDVRIKEGTHSTGDQVTKQLGDKERVAAALENQQLMSVIRKMLETCV